MRLPGILTGAAVLAFIASVQAQRLKSFPEWKVSPLGLEGEWRLADAVVTGTLREVQPAGVQKLTRVPVFVPGGITNLYWCHGRLYPGVALKGNLPSPGSKFLWASVQPGCEMKDPIAAPPVTQVWFIRNEGAYLRPVVDGPTFYFYSLHVTWSGEEGPMGAARFAHLLLDPSAEDATPSGLAPGLSSIAGLACLILGTSECAKDIRHLSALGDPKLRKAACEYLEQDLRQAPCGAP